VRLFLFFTFHFFKNFVLFGSIIYFLHTSFFQKSRFIWGVILFFLRLVGKIASSNKAVVCAFANNGSITSRLPPATQQNSPSKILNNALTPFLWGYGRQAVFLCGIFLFRYETLFGIFVYFLL
jgi:hypothetical protein